MGQLASGAPHTVRMRRRTQQASTQRKLPRRPERAGARRARVGALRSSAGDLRRGQNHQVSHLARPNRAFFAPVRVFTPLTN